MAGTDVDTSIDGESTEALTIAVMRLWAAAMQIEQSFCLAEIKSISGLEGAIEAVRNLPLSVGWTDVAPYDWDS